MRKPRIQLGTATSEGRQSQRCGSSYVKVPKRAARAPYWPARVYPNRYPTKDEDAVVSSHPTAVAVALLSDLSPCTHTHHPSY